jgi:hypothetical protein
MTHCTTPLVKKAGIRPAGQHKSRGCREGGGGGAWHIPQWQMSQKTGVHCAAQLATCTPSQPGVWACMGVCLLITAGHEGMYSSSRAIKADLLTYPH